MADFFAENPYLRRYQIAPEQQDAYARYLLARMQGGTGPVGVDMRLNAAPLAMTPLPSETEQPETSPLPPTQIDVQLVRADGPPSTSEMPPANAPMPSDRRSIDSIFGYPNYTPIPPAELSRPAPNYTPMPGSPPTRPIPDTPAKIGEARKAGYSASEIVDLLAESDPSILTARSAGSKDEEILNRLAPPPPPPSVGRQVLDGVGDAISAVGDAVSTGRDWVETRGNRAFGNAAGLPRAIVENSGIGSLVPSMMPYVRKYLPNSDEATNFIRRHGGIFPTGKRDEIVRARIEGRELPLPPETNLPGRWGKIVDSAVEGVVVPALTRFPPNVGPLITGGALGAGLALLRDARRRALEPGPDRQQSGYSFGDLFTRGGR